MATLLYPVCDYSFRAIYGRARLDSARRSEVIGVALKSRGERDDLLRAFRGGQYCFDMLIDVELIAICIDTGAVINTGRLTADGMAMMFRGYSVNPAPSKSTAMRWMRLSPPGSLTRSARQYLLPFGARSRFLFKMDFSEVEIHLARSQQCQRPFQLSRGSHGR